MDQLQNDGWTHGGASLLALEHSGVVFLTRLRLAQGHGEERKTHGGASHEQIPALVLLPSV